MVFLSFADSLLNVSILGGNQKTLITGQIIDDVQLAFVMVKNILYKYGGCLSSDTSDSNRLLGFNQEKSLRWAGVVTGYKQ